MWLILQNDVPDDFVLATGNSYTVRKFCELAFREVGIELTWSGEGIKEKGINKKDNKTLIEIDERYFRPTEVDFLKGDASKANKILNWKPEVSFEELVSEMVKADLERIKKEI